MKLIAYFLFAVSVLLVSAFARAENLMMLPMVRQHSYSTPVHIRKVDAIDLDAMKVYVSGTLPNICTADPIPEVALEEDALVVRLSTPLQVEPCVDQVKEFSLALDLPALVKASGIPLDSARVYEIKTADFGFLLNAVGAELIR